MEMQMSTNGGLDEMIAALVRSQNMPEIIRIFKEIPEGIVESKTEETKTEEK